MSLAAVLALVLGTAATSPTTSPAALHDRALAKVAAADPADSLDLFERALEASPNDLRWGAEYRQAAIAAEAYDRAIDFFEKLTASHPDAANAFLNCGYAYVDKIPAAGSITQVILANTAIERFTSALAVDDSWLGRFTRGNSYIYWPPIFERTRLGIADLEKAVEMSEKQPDKPYFAHAYAALGDGWWRLKDLDRARQVWRRGLARFPDDPALGKRLSLEGEALDTYLDGEYELGKRVATDLGELWETP